MRQTILLILILSVSQTALAEPWLGNKFAQNCAGCHAPGRKNLAAIDRRCTLSCQGCHVNPNGGGIRNFYGRWNSDRWLRSYRTEFEKATRTVAPTKKQQYGKEKYKSQKGKHQWIFEEGVALNELSQTSVDEAVYDRRDKLEFVQAKSWKEFLYQVPKGDSYRQFDYGRVDAGGDVRWLWQSLQSESNSNSDVEDSGLDWTSFLMSVDVGIRYRPVHRYLHLVYEGRMFGRPGNDVKKRDVLKNAGTRSLYAMVDNLPFNTFVMGGWYRPLINASSPDHNSISEKMLATTLTGSPRSQTMLFNTATIGTAPNVPFANLHYIMRKKTIGGDIDGDRTQGYAINMGLRFVSLGGAVNYTYWKTTDQNVVTEEKTTHEIFTFGLSGQLWRVTSGLEFLSFARDQEDTDFRRGGVIVAKTRTQIWRQNYLLLHYSMANRTIDLLPGKGSQLKLGVRAFHFAGFDTTLTYDLDEQTADGEKQTAKNTRKTSYVTGQIHFYF